MDPYFEMMMLNRGSGNIPRVNPNIDSRQGGISMPFTEGMEQGQVVAENKALAPYRLQVAKATAQTDTLNAQNLQQANQRQQAFNTGYQLLSSGNMMGYQAWKQKNPQYADSVENAQIAQHINQVNGKVQLSRGLVSMYPTMESWNAALPSLKKAYPEAILPTFTDPSDFNTYRQQTQALNAKMSNATSKIGRDLQDLNKAKANGADEYTLTALKQQLKDDLQDGSATATQKTQSAHTSLLLAQARLNYLQAQQAALANKTNDTSKWPPFEQMVAFSQDATTNDVFLSALPKGTNQGKTYIPGPQDTAQNFILTDATAIMKQNPKEDPRQAMARAQQDAYRHIRITVTTDPRTGKPSLNTSQVQWGISIPQPKSMTVPDILAFIKQYGFLPGNVAAALSPQ